MKKTILLFAISLFCASNAALQAPGFMDDGKMSFELGYVNKQFVTDFGRDGVFHENLFGDEDKFLHGMQLGMFYHPTYKTSEHLGIGLRTGLAYEQYFASGETMGYDRFLEGDIYIPINGCVVIPFLDDKADISLHAGVNMNCIIYGELSSGDRLGKWGNIVSWLTGDAYWAYNNRYYKAESLNYGEDGWPKRVNFAYEFGLTFRYDNFYLRGTYSRGLTNHNFYRGEHENYKTRERKLTITIGFTI